MKSDTSKCGEKAGRQAERETSYKEGYKTGKDDCLDAWELQEKKASLAMLDKVEKICRQLEDSDCGCDNKSEFDGGGYTCDIHTILYLIGKTVDLVPKQIELLDKDFARLRAEVDK